MKTLLPQAIVSINMAKAFLSDLYKNGEAFHPEDDAHGVDWSHCDTMVTNGDCDQLNKLMHDIYNLPRNYLNNLAFDPCEYLNTLNYEKSDVWIDQVNAAVKAFNERTENGLLAIDFLINDLERIKSGEIVFD